MLSLSPIDPEKYGDTSTENLLGVASRPINEETCASGSDASIRL